MVICSPPFTLFSKHPLTPDVCLETCESLRSSLASLAPSNHSDSPQYEFQTLAQISALTGVRHQSGVQMHAAVPVCVFCVLLRPDCMKCFWTWSVRMQKILLLMCVAYWSATTLLAVCWWIFFCVLLGFVLLSTRFLHSFRESGHYSWSFVPGYGMVKQACYVMQPFAYVCLPASLYLLLEECLLRIEFRYRHLIFREYSSGLRKINMHFLVESFKRACLFSCWEQRKYALMYHESSLKLEKAF